MQKEDSKLMSKYDLSVLIPARNEQFLSRTVEDVLRNKRGKTEVIVGLDGEWADPPIPAHDDVTIFYSPVSLGQRGMTNQLCRLSQAKYVMKLDAHCTLGEGFDTKLIDAMEGHDSWTIVPLMRNLHAFDWVCKSCGSRQYQGPSEKYKKCGKCGKDRVKEIIWKAKDSPKSSSFCFDPTPHFQYFNDFKKRPEGQGDLTPTMSLQGSCFMLTREKYWELNICDEEFGSWGSQGIEVAVKTWLSGGEVMCLQTTYYAHLFRTQGGDFSFPYPLSGNQVEKAKKFAKNLFFENKWPQQVRPLSWLLEKFWPVPGWTEEDLAKIKRSEGTTISKDITFYTDNKLKLKYAHAVQNQLKSIGLSIVSASLKPMPHFGSNIHVPLERGLEAYFTQIISALEKSTADIVYMCEHDVLYHKSHFGFTPPTKDHFYYNLNFWRIRPEVDNFAVHWDAPQVSGLVCYREFLLSWYRKRWEQVQQNGFDRSYEPGGRNGELVKTFTAEFPNIDIRHGNNLTKSKWSPNDFRDKSTCINWQESTIDKIPGWDLLAIL
jgi:hypothetical protein